MRGPALALATLVAFVPAPAAAAVFVLTTSLSGLNEFPTPVITTGSGTATVTLDTTANTLLLDVSFANLTGTSSMAHIHCCAPPPVNTPVATVTPAFPGFPLGVTSGAYSQSFDLTQASFYRTGFVTANGGVANARNVLVNGLLSGQAYFNLHTSQFPGGEIRGQFPAVPEPATWALMILGFGLTGAAIRRRGRVTTHA